MLVYRSLVLTREWLYDSVVCKARDPSECMLRLTNLRSVALIIVLGLGLVPPAAGLAVLSAEIGGDADGSPPGSPTAAVQGHSVKLSWAASVAASKSPRDAVVGYNVYRSTKSHDTNPKRINSKLCPGTAYTDTDVEAGKTYYYVTRGVTANGVESGPSNEIKVKIQSHD
jgi:hypothetical protein